MDRQLHARHQVATLVLKLLAWHHVSPLTDAYFFTTTNSPTSEFDPFLATDLPTASTDGSGCYDYYYDVPLQSPDLDSSSDYLAGLTSATYSQPPQTSSSIVLSGTTTIQITKPISTITTLPITTLPPTTVAIAPTTTSPSNNNNFITTTGATSTITATTNATTDNNCQQGAGSCFFTANQLGARGCNIQSSSLTTLLVITSTSCLARMFYL